MNDIVGIVVLAVLAFFCYMSVSNTIAAHKKYKGKE